MLPRIINKAIMITLSGILCINMLNLSVKATGDKKTVLNNALTGIDDHTVDSGQTDPNMEKKIITGFGIFDIREHYITIKDNDRPSLEQIVSMMPESLEVQLDGKSEMCSIPVSWHPITEDYEEQEKYYYQFNPEWDNDLYVLSEKLDDNESIPYIGVFVEKTEKTGNTILKSSAPVTGKAVETEVYNFLRSNMNVNVAVACGVLANIQCESIIPAMAVMDYANGMAIETHH